MCVCIYVFSCSSVLTCEFSTALKSFHISFCISFFFLRSGLWLLVSCIFSKCCDSSISVCLPTHFSLPLLQFTQKDAGGAEYLLQGIVNSYSLSYYINFLLCGKKKGNLWVMACLGGGAVTLSACKSKPRFDCSGYYFMYLLRISGLFTLLLVYGKAQLLKLSFKSLFFRCDAILTKIY